MSAEPQRSEFLPSVLDPLGILNPVKNSQGQSELDGLRTLYERNSLAQRAETDSYLIPRTIHQIWIGSPSPAWFLKLAATWRHAHPDWNFQLWDDARVAQFNFSTRDLFERADCYGQKADILRAEILHRFGGVYVDCDFECLLPIDTFLKRYEFFVGASVILQAHLGWPEIWTSPVIASNAIIGSRAEHPVLAHYLSMIRENWRSSEAYSVARGELPSIAIQAMGGKRRAQKIKELGLRTFLPFHHACLAEGGKNGRRDTVLPYSYFYPMLGTGTLPLQLMPQLWALCWERKKTWPALAPYHRLHENSYANHLSTQTWLAG